MFRSLSRKLQTIALILIICMTVGLVIACKTSNVTPTPPPGPTPDGPELIEPSGIATVTTDVVRVQLLSDTLVRIENRGPEGFEDRASYIVTNRNNWGSTPYAVIDTAEEKQV